MSGSGLARGREPLSENPPPRPVTAPPTRGRPPMPRRTVTPQRAATPPPPRTATPPRRASTRRPASTQRRAASVANEPSSWQLAMEARMERSEQTLAGITDVLAQLVEKLPDAAEGRLSSPHRFHLLRRLRSSRRQATLSSQGSTTSPVGSSPCLPIHMHVADKEKQKIWADVYVDLISLLNENTDDERYALAVTSGGMAIAQRYTSHRAERTCFAPTLSGRRPFRCSFQSTCPSHRERPTPLRSSSTNRRCKI